MLYAPYNKKLINKVLEQSIINDCFNTYCMNTSRVQNINEELYLSGTILGADKIVTEMNKEENLHFDKLRLTNFDSDCISALANAPAHLKCNLRCFAMCEGVVRSDSPSARIIVDFIAGSKLSKLEILRGTVPDTALAMIIDATQSSLCHIKLERHYIGTATVRAIINLLDRSSLVKLSFFSCTFEDNAIASMMEAIKRSNLKVLILSCTHFVDAEMIALVNCVLHSRLTKLSLCGSSFDGKIGFALIEAIVQSSLKTLDARAVPFLQRFDIINDVILNSNITKFKFNRWQLGPEENVILFDSIKQRNLFKYISFSYVRFNDQLLSKLCNLLENSHLTSIDLHYCSLSSADLGTIINSIKKSSITSFYYSDCLNAGHTLIIRDMLEHCDLTKLKLICSDYINGTISALLPSIKKSSLIKFEVYDWRLIDERERKKIKQILQHNQQNLSANYKTKSARTL